MLSWAKKMQSTPTAQVFFSSVRRPGRYSSVSSVRRPGRYSSVRRRVRYSSVRRPGRFFSVRYPGHFSSVRRPGRFPPFPTASPAFASPRFSTSPAQSPVLTSGILLSTSAPRLSDSNISVPLLNEHDAGRDGAIRDYYIWRAIALLLHCTSRQLILHFFISYPPSGAILHRPHGLGYMSILYIR